MAEWTRVVTPIFTAIVAFIAAIQAYYINLGNRALAFQSGIYRATTAM